MVPVARARFPKRCFLRECGRDPLPVVETAFGYRLPHRRYGRLVVEEHAHGDGVLAVLRKLRPVLLDRRIQVQLPAVDQDVRAERSGALGAGPNRAHRVRCPGPAALGFGQAGPEVDDRLAFDHQTHGRAHLAALGKVALELLTHPRERGLADTTHLGGFQLSHHTLQPTRPDCCRQPTPAAATPSVPGPAAAPGGASRRRPARTSGRTRRSSRER